MAAFLLFVTVLMVQGGVSLEVIRGGQAPPPRDPRAAPSTGTGVIKGRVTAADTGAPMRRAIVQLSGSPRPRGAYTDEDGRYVLENVPPGTYMISASPGSHRAGYRGLTLGMDPNGTVNTARRLEVANGQAIEDVDFALPRGAAITGRVTDAYGDPAARVQVRALMVRAGSEPMQSGPGASTDDLGHFRIFGLTPGDYVVVAEPQPGGGPADVEAPRLGLARTFAPGTHSRDEAMRVRLRAGTEVALDVRLLETPVFTIRGTVLNSSGEPVRNAGVSLMRLDGGSGGGAMGGGMDPSGQFTLRNVAPGTYDLVANYTPPNVRPDANGRMEGREMAMVRVDVASADIDGLVVTTSPGATFTGQIVYDEPAPEGLRAQVNVIPGQQRTFGPSGRVEVKGDTFVVHETFGRVLLRGNAGLATQAVRQVPPPGGLSPGIPQPGWALKHVLLNGKDITDVPTEFSAAHGGRVQVVFTSRAPSLEGTVLDDSGQPARATVLVFSADEETWTANSSRIRSGPVIRDDGKFMLRGLRAGRYYAAALPAGPMVGPSAPDREFLRALKASATEVMLNEGETRAVDLRLIRVE